MPKRDIVVMSSSEQWQEFYRDYKGYFDDMGYSIEVSMGSIFLRNLLTNQKFLAKVHSDQRHTNFYLASITSPLPIFITLSPIDCYPKMFQMMVGQKNSNTPYREILVGENYFTFEDRKTKEDGDYKFYLSTSELVSTAILEVTKDKKSHCRKLVIEEEYLDISFKRYSVGYETLLKTNDQSDSTKTITSTVTNSSFATAQTFKNGVLISSIPGFGYPANSLLGQVASIGKVDDVHDMLSKIGNNLSESFPNCKAIINKRIDDIIESNQYSQSLQSFLQSNITDNLPLGFLSVKDLFNQTMR